MAYGTLKVDNITFTNSGVDQTVTVSGIVHAISGNITVTGTVQAQTIIGVTVSGGTVTGDAGAFNTLTGNTAGFTTITGTTVTGTSANFVSGIFTGSVSGTTVKGSTVSGAVVTGDAGQFLVITGGTAGFTTVTGTTVTGTNANFVSGSFSGQISGATVKGTVVSGATVTGDAGQFTTLTGVTAGFSTVTGTTVTGTNANFVNGLFSAQVSGSAVRGTTISGATVTGETAQFTVITGGTAGFTTITGTTVTGTTANFVNGVFTAQISGATITGNNAQFTSVTGGTAGFTTVTGTTVTGTTANFVNGVFSTQVSGTTVRGTTVSGATVTGTAGQFGTVTGNTAGFTTITGTTVSGTTANFVNGVFTNQISGATVTGNIGRFTVLTGDTAGFTTITGTTVTGTNVNFVNGLFSTQVSGTTVRGATVSGATVTGTAGQFGTVTGNTAGFTTVTGTTVTGSIANFVSGVFTAQVSGVTITGNLAQFTTLTGNTAGFTTVTGTTVTGTTANFATLSGTTITGGAVTVASGIYTGNVTAAAFIPTGSTAPTNGLYLPAANSVALATSGSGRLLIDSFGSVRFPDGGLYGKADNTGALGVYGGGAFNQGAGAVFYGSSHPTNPNLIQFVNGAFAERARIRSDGTFEVKGAGAAGVSPAFSVSGSAPTNSLVVDSSGNVGVGSAAAARLQVQHNQAGFSYFDYYNTTTGGSIVWRMIVRNIADTGNTSVDMAKFSGAGFVIINNDTNVLNYTAFNIGAFERLRITSAGNVGIGTVSPSQLLSITTATNDDGIILTNSSANGGRLRLNSTGTGGRAYHIASTANGSGTGGGKFVVFDNTASDAARLVINSSGNVGIGTSSPEAGHLLQVNGVIASVTSFGSFTALQAAGGAGFRWTLNNDSTFRLQRTANGFSTSTTPILIDSSDRVGIGTVSPGAVLHSVAAVAGGNPSTSGTADANVAARFQASSVNLDVGVQASGHIWLQPRLVSNFASNFNLLLCPNGGLVGIGTVSPAQLLHVQGVARLQTSATGTVGLEIYNGTRNTGISSDFANSITYIDHNQLLVFRDSQNSYVTRFAVRADGMFEVKGAGTVGVSPAFSVNGSAPANSAIVDSSGRLLVGTASSINTVIQAGLQLQSSGANAYLSVGRWDNNTANPGFIFNKSRGASPGTRAVVQAEDSLGQIAFTGDDGSAFVIGAEIKAVVDGTPGANDMPGRLIFNTTADGAASPTERLRITNDGVRGYNQPAPVAVDATATLTVANLKTGIITSTTAAAVTMTLPTGTLTEGGFSGLYNNFTFEWTVINTGATNAVTVQGGTDHTLVGSGTVAAGVSGRFASRRTAANTFVTYRLS